MAILKQQVLFLLVAFLSVLIFFLYQEDINKFFQLNDIYLKSRLYKYAFSVILNYALISLFYVFLRKTIATILLSQFVVFLLTFINIKKEQYLSSSLVPSDFLLIKETFISSPMPLKATVLTAVFLFIGLFILLYRKEKKAQSSLLWVNGICACAILTFFVMANFKDNFSKYCSNTSNIALCQYTGYLPNTRGDWIGDHLSIRNLGFTAFFFSKSVDSLNTKIFQTAIIPQSNIQNILNPFANASNIPVDDSEISHKTQSDQHHQILPNIIFVMSESHWDASKLDPSIPKNITPTINQNQVSNLLSPSFGGGTANVEFEVLTSLNVSLNHHELVYVSKLKKPTYSLPMYLNSLGYDTTAMHNNGKYFYNRSAVYQNLGFKRFSSLENMVSMADRKNFINQAGWANDDLLYNNIRSQLKNTEQPQFIYAISVENHPMYNDDRFGSNHFKITKEGISDSSKRQLNTYLSGMQRADDKLKALIADVKTLKRPTIIIFFGDHLPNLQKVYDDYGFFASEQEKAEKNNVKFFETPLAIWSNFPIDRRQFKSDFIAAHFLAPKVLKAAHVPLSPYYVFMDKVSSCYSAIHSTVSNPQKQCQFEHNLMLNQYKDINTDILNGKNYSYQLLKQTAES